MKKILLIISVFCVQLSVFSQVVLSQDFESATFPPAGWTLETTNAAYTWTRNTTTPISGTADMSIAYDPTPAAQDESLVSPVFSLTGSNHYLSFDFSMSYYWAVSPNNNYDVKLYISTNGGTTWTEIWSEDTFGTFSNFVLTNAVVDLSSYSGNTNCKLKVSYTGNDGAQAKIDNIKISNCYSVSNIFYQNPTQTSFEVAYTSSASNVDIQYGPVGFTLGSGTTVTSAASPKVISSLNLNTNYSYYIRSNCGTTQSEWNGPFYAATLFTAPYSSGFDNNADVTGWSGNWGIGNTAGAAQAGTQYIFSNSSTTAATNAIIYCKPILAQAGEQFTLTYYTRLGSATGSPQTLKTYVNTTRSLTGATQIGTTVTVSTATYAQQTATYTAPSAGVYYFAFNNVTPIITTATSLRLDTFNISSVLSTNEVLANSFSMTPNPAKNFVTINSTDDNAINAVEVVDINGRTVLNAKPNAIESNIDLSTLSSGVYMVKINSEKGSVTKKLVKE